MEKAAEIAAKQTPAVRAEVSKIGRERHVAEMKKVTENLMFTVKIVIYICS